MRSLITLFAPLLLVAAPALAGDVADLLLREPEELVAACHQAPTEVRAEARRGGWAVAATDAGVLVTPPGSAPRLLTTCDGLPSNRITGVAAMPDGTWLVSTLGAGVVRLALADDGALRGATPLDGIPPLLTTAVAARGDEVWVGTAEEGVWRWRAGVVDQPLKKARDGLVTAIAAPPGRWVYVARGRRGLYEGNPRRGTIWRVLKDRYVRRLDVVDGRVVAESPSAVCTLTVGGRDATCGAPPDERAVLGSGPAPHVTALAVHAGRLWVGTFDQGLWTWDGHTWRRDERSAGDAVLGYVNDLEERDGVLWLASPNGAARHDGRDWRVLGAKDGLPEGHVNAVLPTADAVWFATSEGVLRLDERGPTLFGRRAGLPGPLVYDLAEDGEGRLLVGTNRGLARLAGGRFETFTHEGGQLSDNWVNAVAFWEDAVVTGTYDAGVDEETPEGWRPAATPTPLWVNPGGLFPLDGVLAVAALGDGLWTRTPDGAWFPWTASRIVPDPDVTAVAEFEGRIWVATRAGLASWSAAPESADVAAR